MFAIKVDGNQWRKRKDRQEDGERIRYKHMKYGEEAIICKEHHRCQINERKDLRHIKHLRIVGFGVGKFIRNRLWDHEQFIYSDIKKVPHGCFNNEHHKKSKQSQYGPGIVYQQSKSHSEHRLCRMQHLLFTSYVHWGKDEAGWANGNFLQSNCSDGTFAFIS